MMVKVLTRHTPSFASLLTYIIKGSTSDTPEIFTHNLRSNSVHGWTQEYLATEAGRKLTRSNQIYLYHEIISFSALENKNTLTPDVLSAIAHKYIELRGTQGVYFGAVHREGKAHVHIHFCTSGVALRTGKAMRLSRADLHTLKTELQVYQQSTFPELTQSICEHGSGKPYTTHRAWWAKERNAITSNTTDTVRQCFGLASSHSDFLHRLRDNGLHHYERNGISTGIITESGRKFRFSRLGIDVDVLMKYTPEEDKALQDIQRLREQTTDVHELEL